MERKSSIVPGPVGVIRSCREVGVVAGPQRLQPEVGQLLQLGQDLGPRLLPPDLDFPLVELADRVLDVGCVPDLDVGRRQPLEHPLGADHVRDVVLH